MLRTGLFETADDGGLVRATAGFSFTGVRKVAVTVRGYFSGSFEVRTAWDGELLGTIPVEFYNFWTERTAAVTVPDGVSALYLTFRGNGSGQLKGFRLG